MMTANGEAVFAPKNKEHRGIKVIEMDIASPVENEKKPEAPFEDVPSPLQPPQSETPSTASDEIHAALTDKTEAGVEPSASSAPTEAAMDEPPTPAEEAKPPQHAAAKPRAKRKEKEYVQLFSALTPKPPFSSHVSFVRPDPKDDYTEGVSKKPKKQTRDASAPASPSKGIRTLDSFFKKKQE
jgi:hypothetical protein